MHANQSQSHHMDDYSFFMYLTVLSHLTCLIMLNRHWCVKAVFNQTTEQREDVGLRWVNLSESHLTTAEFMTMDMLLALCY